MLEATKKVIQDQAAREVAPLLMVRAKCTVGMLSLLKALSSFFGQRRFSDGRHIDETLDALNDGMRWRAKPQGQSHTCVLCLCSMHWHAKPWGQSHACVCLFGFVFVCVFVTFWTRHSDFFDRTP